MGFGIHDEMREADEMEAEMIAAGEADAQAYYAEMASLEAGLKEDREWLIRLLKRCSLNGCNGCELEGLVGCRDLLKSVVIDILEGIGDAVAKQQEKCE